MDRAFVASFLLSLLVFVVAGCDEPSSTTCDPGDVQACSCGAGAALGIQECLADGSDWDLCQCDNADGDGDVDGDGDGDGDADGEQDGDVDADVDPDVDLDFDIPARDFGPTTFINSLYLPVLETDTPCCFDYNGDGALDNALGGFLLTMSGMVGDLPINEALQSAITEGTAPLLLEFHSVDDWAEDADLEVRYYVGLDSDADFSDNIDPAQVGTFLAARESFSRETLNPATFVDSRIETGGHAVCEPETTCLLPMPSAFSTGVSLVPQSRTLIDGDVTVVADSDPLEVSIANGRIGGFLPFESILGDLNAFVADACSCLGVEGDLIDAETRTCATGGDPTACTGEAEDCAQLYEFCALIIGMWGLSLDGDLDADGTLDAMSVGYHFTSIPAEIVGIEP